LANDSRPIAVNRVVDDPVAMDTVFHALARQARRDMLARLPADPLTAGQLAAPLAMSLAVAAKTFGCRSGRA
jgi:DNA-binding transcriptional ArsR family regulator